jgi:peptidoglycan/LPS O-acetylase OafA/YrhL
VVATSIGLYLLAHFGRSLLPFSSEVLDQVLHWSPIQYGLGFCLGIAAFRFRERYPNLTRWQNLAWVFLVLAFSVLLSVPRSMMHQLSYVFFSSVSFVIIIFGSRDNLIVRCVLENKAALLLGALSYGIYLSHLTIIGLNDRWHFAQQSGAKFALTLFCSIGISAVAYVCVERPALAFGKKIYKRFS